MYNVWVVNSSQSYWPSASYKSKLIRSFFACNNTKNNQADFEHRVPATYLLYIPQCPLSQTPSAAGVVVSCKIPILATRVRFPGGASFFYPPGLLKILPEYFYKLTIIEVKILKIHLVYIYIYIYIPNVTHLHHARVNGNPGPSLRKRKIYVRPILEGVGVTASI